VKLTPKARAFLHAAFRKAGLDARHGGQPSIGIAVIQVGACQRFRDGHCPNLLSSASLELALIGGHDRVHRGWVDPRRSGWRFLRGLAAHEALGVTEVGRVEDPLSRGDDGGRPTVMHVDGVKQREAGVVVLVMRCDA